MMVKLIFFVCSTQASVYKVNENCIDFLLKKRKHETWPRLTLYRCRRAWLRVNFEKSYWKDVDDEIAFDKKRNEELEFYQRNDLSSLGNEMYFKDRDKFLRLVDPTDRPLNKVEFMRKFYLTLYNLIQLYGAIYLFTILLIRYNGLGGF